jgi:hypothetical protein
VTHPIDGDLSHLVEACRPGYTFEKYGLIGCDMDTSTPKNFTVSFTITLRRETSADDSVEFTKTVTRTVVVYPLCSSQETLCDDLTCDPAGLCLGREQLSLPLNTAPLLTLPPNSSAHVFVPQGRRYEACNATTASLCEAGMMAFDREDGYLNAKVLACPPEDCLPYACPGHEYSRKGVPSWRWCLADLGTIYTSFHLL